MEDKDESITDVEKVTTDIETTEDEKTMMGGLKSIGFGLILIGVAYYFYLTMTSYENGEGISMNRILLLAYKFLGKNATTGILGFIGVIVSFAGVLEILASKKKE